MKEYIKSYHVFLPGTFLKWCLYVLYPLLLIVFLYIMNREVGYYYFACMGFAACVSTVVELLVNTYQFAGITAKKNNDLEYLKSSAKGIAVLEKALRMDAVRRFFSIFLIMTALYKVFPNRGYVHIFLAIGAGICVVVSCVEIGLFVLSFFQVGLYSCLGYI